MQAEQFVFWFQGFLELNPDLKTINEEQVKIIKQHLQLVFQHMPDAETLAHDEIDEHKELDEEYDILKEFRDKLTEKEFPYSNPPRKKFIRPAPYYDHDDIMPYYDNHDISRKLYC